LWNVAADDLQLGHALYELALNSQEAMPEGGRFSMEAENVAIAEADLAAHPAGHIGDFVRLSICDTGAGMSPTVRAHAFEPCFTTKAGGRAAGLGLALIAAIVEQQRGWIECQSQLRHGTQFEIYLPRYQTDAPVQSSGSNIQKPHGATPTILLAEPDPMVRDLGRRILEAEGYRVLLAEDGVQAVNIFQQEPQSIDLAILDLNIPKLTPYAVLERLVELDPHVRVLFSGGYFTEDLTNSDGHTMGVVTKPYHHDELIQMVRHSLAKHAKER
jgi:CheY-like chemotaxis protein